MQPVDFGVPYKSCHEIRSSFIQFFKDQEHKFVPSSSIAPHDDPTLLFVNSGMTQFKALFLGDNRQGLKRAVNSQKCLRVSGKHNDLDEVGCDGTHHTFFEMLGNWSFGDYYKKEAIVWAWQLLTEVWRLPKNRLFVTVYTTDEEAKRLWLEHTDITADRILYFEKENFWEMGAVGPCGPCSEIHFDRGSLSTQEATFKDPVQGVNGPNERYMEIWNLVFMQSERMADGSLRPLKETHVDTGSGLERICSVVQNKTSNYDTDVFLPLIQQIASLSGVAYQSDATGTPHRVIADHIRGLSFAIADGATPGNEGRGYVLRRILRRASRFAYQQLGQREPFLFKLVPLLAAQMSGVYPELGQRQDYIAQVLQSEETRFLRTLGQGLSRLDKLITDLKKDYQNKILGKDVFLFHDTFGFPSDLTRMIAAEHKMVLDEQGFEVAMQEQQERARKSQKFASELASDEHWVLLQPQKDSLFLGYDSLRCPVTALRFQEKQEYIYLVLDQTPFYAESGGQVGDIGLIQGKDVQLRVIDTFKVFDMHVHKTVLADGFFTGTPEQLTGMIAQVDPLHRGHIKRNHSATHLLQAALRKLLGAHIVQQGSHVGADRLRFDFTHHQGLDKPTQQAVEALVNQEILANTPVYSHVMGFEQAKTSGAMALFGETYGDTVRVLTMGQDAFSKELCGGTHVHASGDIGFFKITLETSISAGVRRIEAVTGTGALGYVQTQDLTLHALTQVLKTPEAKLGEKVAQMEEKIHALEKSSGELRVQLLSRQIEHIVARYRTPLFKHTMVDALILCHFDMVKGTKEVTLSPDYYSKFIELFAEQMPPKDVAVITLQEKEQLLFLVAMGRQSCLDYQAYRLVHHLNEISSGRGGGRQDYARGGTKVFYPELLERLHEAVRAWVIIG